MTLHVRYENINTIDFKFTDDNNTDRYDFPKIPPFDTLYNDIEDPEEFEKDEYPLYDYKVSGEN